MKQLLKQKSTIDWQEVSLDEVAIIVTGNTPPTGNRANYGTQYMFVSPADLGDTKYVESSEKMLSATGMAQARKIPAGSTLFVCIGSIGKVGIATEEVATNQQINSLIPKGNIDPEFLFYAASTLSSVVQDQATQQVLPLVNKSQFSQFKVLLPSLSEQRVIARVLRDVDDQIATFERLIAKKQSVKQGMMQQLLTGRTRLPGFEDEWITRSLGELGVFLRGRGVKRDDVLTTGTPCIRYGELYTEFVDYTKTTRSFVARDVAATALPIQSGDILFAGSGETRAEIGTCVAYIGDQPAVAGGDIIVLRGASYNPVYLATLANTPRVVNQKARVGQGDAVVHIYSQQLAEVLVSMPPRSEQDAISQIILDFDKEIDLLRERLEKARSVKDGMMQQLLTGRVRLPVEVAV